MFPCLPPANRICEESGVQPFSITQPSGALGDPKLALSLPHPQLHVQGHGKLPPATPELPAEAFGAMLGMAFPCLWGNVGDSVFTAEDSVQPPLWVNGEREPLELLGERPAGESA